MTNGRVLLIGAVHESLAALNALAAHPQVDLVRVLTLTPELAAKTSGAIDLGGAAAALVVDVMYVEDVNKPEVVAEIRACDPDLIAVVGWTRLIHDELLALPRRGCVGFHASLLPRNRGRAPVNWAIIRGETQTGNTLMVLDQGADTGRIVDQRATPIDPDDTCGSVYERVAALGADMLTDNICALLDGTAPLLEQDDALANVLPKRTPDMGVTDWTRSAREIHDWIRALTDPYPGAFTHLEGRRVMLWASEHPKDDDPDATGLEDGTVLGVDPRGLRVVVGGGTLLLTRVGDPAEPPESAHHWCLRSGVVAGTQFEIPARDVVAWSLGQGPRPTGGVA